MSQFWSHIKLASFEIFGPPVRIRIAITLLRVNISGFQTENAKNRAQEAKYYRCKATAIVAHRISHFSLLSYLLIKVHMFASRWPTTLPLPMQLISSVNAAIPPQNVSSTTTLVMPERPRSKAKSVKSSIPCLPISMVSLRYVGEMGPTLDQPFRKFVFCIYFIYLFTYILSCLSKVWRWLDDDRVLDYHVIHFVLRYHGIVT